MSAVCRICLDGGSSRLYDVKDNLLLILYENLTKSKFNSEDARTRTLCSLCYQKLLKCHTFSQMAVRSEKILSHLYDEGLEVTHENITEVKLNMKQNLSVAAMQSFIIDDATNAASQVTITVEPLPSIDIKEEVTVKDELQPSIDIKEVTIKEELQPGFHIKEEVITEPDTLVVEDCTKSQVTLDSSDQGDVAEKLLFYIHIEESKPDDSKIKFSCNNCNKIFYIKRKLISHIRNSHHQPIGKHNSFTIKHTEAKSMIKDLRIHNQKKKLTCYVCVKTFNTKSHLIRHIRTHTEENPLACNGDKEFNQNNRHKRNHNGEKPFACHVCCKQFNRKSTLVTHMRTHTGEKPEACHVCDKQFSRKSTLVTHMRTHTDEKPFACHVCYKQFNLKQHLVQHMRNHTGEKPFVCNVCDKQFNRKCTLVRHMRTHSVEKPFACHVCDKQFSLNQYLFQHMKTHTDEKPFACNECEKQFNRNDYLVKHMRTHTGEKPFACNICDKQFNRKHNLLQHMTTHTGEKQFACNVCDKQFNRKHSLVLHMRTHTAAHFLWTSYEPINRHKAAKSTVLVAGKITKSWKEPTDSSLQKSDVKDIHLAPGFKQQGSGAIPFFLDDIAIVLAAKPFIYNAYIRPVCLDFDYDFEQQQLAVGNKGKAVGWGRPTAKLNNDLFVKDLHYVSVDDCIGKEATNEFYANIKLFTLAIADKICVAAKHDNSSLCDGDSGIGVTFPASVQGTERYYLRGVLSIPLNVEKYCTTGTLYGFTSIRKHESFIRKYWNETQEGPRQIGNCVIPAHPDHGTYSTNTSSANVPSGEDFTLVTLSVSCVRGYGVVGSTAVNCYNGFWPEAFPICQRMCHLPPHPSVEYRCLVSGAVVGSRTCAAHEPAGTLVSPRCREPHYYSTNTLTFMRCNNDGSWDYVAKCKPECGKVTPAGKTLVVGGNSSLQGEVPWHVGIYTKTSSPYKQICGGSLISTTLVISAAHCFWTDIEKQLPASQFAIAVGKLYRPWNDRVDDAQKSDVKVIHLPTRYQGAEASFQDDIAVLIAAEPFEYRTHVRPVCLSFDQNFDRLQLQSINKGKVAGWGLTSEDGKESPVLKVIDLPYVEVGTCIVDSPADFREYITSDKICAGTKDVNSALCRGDSGGGLTFPSSDRGTERFYLRGVVSTAPNNDHACNTATYTSFTQITKHEPFIKQFLTEF